MLDLNKTTISEIVKNNLRAGAIFEKYNLDFCCKGNRTLTDACKEKNIDAAPILSELSVLNEIPSAGFMNYEEWNLDFMIDYIINTHHNYVRKSIPIIAEHAAKVVNAHGKNHPETLQVNKIFGVVYKDLKSHMMKEEEILFPYIKYLNKIKQSGGSFESPYFGTVTNQIRMMEQEHQAAGDELFEIRRLTSGYTPPEDACNTFKALYSELKDFEEDLHKHVHLENYILFPKAISLELEMDSVAKAV